MRRLATFFLVIPLLGAIAAPAWAQSSTATVELLAGMVTEEVEPGVYRVISDGVRDVSSRNNEGIVVGRDGSVWLLRENRFLRLGAEGVHQWPNGQHAASGFDVASDGTVWAVGSSIDTGAYEPTALRSYDGERWRAHEVWGEWTGSVVAADDGTVWLQDGPVLVTFRPPDQWNTTFRWGSVAILDDGDTVYVSSDFMGPDPDLLELSVYRSEGGDFEKAEWYAWRSAELDVDRWRGLAPSSTVRIGLDGTVWAFTAAGSSDGTPYVGRLDGDGWREWGPADGVPNISTQAYVSPDGSLWGRWSRPEGDSPDGELDDGVAHFDGETWEQYLAGHEVFSMDVAADGSVWVLADEGEGRDLYVITPEAVTAAE
jgi:hypothetical protein